MHSVDIYCIYFEMKFVYKNIITCTVPDKSLDTSIS